MVGRVPKLLFLLLAALGSLTLCGIVGQATLSSLLCAAESGPDVASPDGQYLAHVEEPHCGAATDYKTHVGLRESGSGQGLPRRLRQRQAPVFQSTHALRDISLRWLDATTLIITYVCDPRQVVAGESSWRDVTITYTCADRVSP
jgi:hypothetical protein